MRRWSELTERVAATTRTSEKTALLADYLRDLTHDELPIAAVFLTGRPFPEADPRTAGLGWAAIMYIVDLVNANVAMMVLVCVGGVLYTIGSVVYGIKKPNPWPGVFGFHEIFHVCTVLAFMCHWTATLLIAMAPVYHVG